jgi:hypothetical protein
MDASHLITPLIAGLTLSAVACGSLSGTTGSESTLARINGTIKESQSSAPVSDLATAIVWVGPTKASDTSVAVSAAFPASFTIDLTAPPPAGTQVDLGDLFGEGHTYGVPIAAGALVAYEDLNHNGKLDLVAPGARAYIDNVIAVQEQDILVYFAATVPAGLTVPGLIPDLHGSRPQAGYNLLVQHPNDCSSAADGGVQCEYAFLWEPIGTPITVTISDAPQLYPLAGYMCTELNGSGSFNVDCQTGNCLPAQSARDFQGPFPSPDDPSLYCLPDGRTFWLSEGCTTTTPGLCLGYTFACTTRATVTLDPPGVPGIAPPPSWPCSAASP